MVAVVEAPMALAVLVSVAEAVEVLAVVALVAPADSNNTVKACLLWTVNKPEDMQKVVNMGINQLTTDEPMLARRLLE